MNVTGDCPSDSALVAFAHGSAHPSARAALEVHVESCASCLEALAVLLQESEGAGSDSAAAANADEHDWIEDAVSHRYVLLDPLGEGAMSVVHAAYDRKLNRRVALKVFKEGGSSPSDPLGHTIREARALAKLTHPNVVTIHDVGLLPDDRVFIAMAFMGGGTLLQWLRGGKRRWPEVLELLLAAGDGLAAAHAMGVVHRDFKPANVMLDLRGTAHVVDLGLADHWQPQQTLVDGSESLDGGTSSVGTRGTTTFKGTPAYASPEQWRRGEVDPRSDQFSFCVVLFESLYGVHPFGGETAERRREAVLEGNVVEPPSGADVPGWIHRCVLRGLQVDPDARYDSMAELLVALRQDPSRARRRLALAGGVVVLAGLGLGGVQLRGRLQRRACELQGDAIGEVWGPGRRQEIGDSASVSSTSATRADFARIADLLDQYADAWAQQRTQSCVATRVEGTMKPELEDRASQCLDAGRDRLEAVVESLTESEPRMLALVRGSATLLPRLEPCADPAYLLPRTSGTEDPVHADAAREIRRRLHRATVARVAGRLDVARERSELLLAEAQALDEQSLVARAKLGLAAVLFKQGECEQPSEGQRDAYFLAGSIRDRETQADAALAIMRSEERCGRPEVALAWGRHAQMALANLNQPEDLRHARLHSSTGYIYEGTNRYPQAEREYRASLVIRLRLLGESHPDVAELYEALGKLERLRGNIDQALVLYERALAIFDRVLGEDSGASGQTWTAIGSSYKQRGDHAQAADAYTRSLRIKELALGPTHLSVAYTLHSIGLLQLAQDRYAEALPVFERAISIAGQGLPSDHPHLATMLSSVARAHMNLGDETRALAMYERAAAVSGELSSSSDASIRANMAVVLLRLHRYDEALASSEAAAAVFEAQGEFGYSDFVTALVNVALAHKGRGDLVQADRTLTRIVDGFGDSSKLDFNVRAAVHATFAELKLERGQLDDALLQAERGADLLRQGPGGNRTVEAQVSYALLKVLLAGPGQRDRARVVETAKQARASFAALGAIGADSLAELDALVPELRD